MLFDHMHSYYQKYLTRVLDSSSYMKDQCNLVTNTRYVCSKQLGYCYYYYWAPTP